MSEFLDSVFFFYFPLKSVENKKLKIPRSKIRTGSIPVSGTIKKRHPSGCLFSYFFSSLEYPFPY